MIVNVTECPACEQQHPQKEFKLLGVNNRQGFTHWGWCHEKDKILYAKVDTVTGEAAEIGDHANYEEAVEEIP